MRKKLPPRVVGIYRDRSRFRVVICEDGKRRSLIVASQEEAQRRADEITALLREPRQRLSVAEAVAEWNRERLARGSCKPLTLREQDARLRSFLVDVLARPIDSIGGEQAQRVYLEAASRPCPKSGKPPAAASQRLYLKLCRALFAWAVEHGHCAENPFADIKPVGEVRPCKPQLGVDEARRFLDAALVHYSQTRDALALAAATALLLGLRTHEVLSRAVGDLDPAAVLLRVERGRGSRPAQSWEVPTVLRPHLLALATGRAPEEPLFGRSRSGGVRSRQALHSLVRRLCQRAGVPAVCIDSLRGLFAQLGPRSGTVPHAVAASLGLGTWPQPQSAGAWALSPPAASAAAPREADAPHATSALPLATIEPGLPLSSLSAEQIVAAIDASTLHRLRALLATGTAASLPPPPASPESPPLLPRERASQR